MQRLPVELLHEIFRCAARDTVSEDRKWVVQLALVSPFVYDLVSLILYRTMVVTSRNHSQLEYLAQSENSLHVFRAVRYLVADDWLNLWPEHRLRSLFSGVTSIDASLATVQILSRAPEFRPTYLAVLFAKLADLAARLPAPTRAHVTHLVGYFPNRDESVPPLEEALGELFDSMPALTHLAFEVLSLSRGDSDSESDSDDDDQGVDAPLDMTALVRTIRAVLKQSHIQAVALRVAADWLPHWPAVLRLAEHLKDARLSLWHDTRPITSWAREAQFAAEDAWAGRNIWTEAQQVWHPDASVSRSSSDTVSSNSRMFQPRFIY